MNMRRIQEKKKMAAWRKAYHRFMNTPKLLLITPEVVFEAAYKLGQRAGETKVHRVKP